MANKRLWYFWATDSDRSWGWSNHVYTMGAAFRGEGDTAELALAEAKEAKREDFTVYCACQDSFIDINGDTLPLVDDLIAIPVDAEVSIKLTITPEQLGA